MPEILNPPTPEPSAVSHDYSADQIASLNAKMDGVTRMITGLRFQRDDRSRQVPASVSRPWWASPWVIGGGICLAALGGYVAGRASVVGKEQATDEAGRVIDGIGRKVVGKLSDRVVNKALKGIGL
ncbi:MAG: hypothetical protein HYT87_05555 [Nitrospirae bacterium]|nr:hypothetical protein [Nitrospirota bacterium]